MNIEVLRDLIPAAFALSAVVGTFLTVRRRIVGRDGVVIEGSSPQALIQVIGQKWRAVAANGVPLQPGDAVVVLRLQGLQLAVVEKKSPSRRSPAT